MKGLILAFTDRVSTYFSSSIVDTSSYVLAKVKIVHIACDMCKMCGKKPCKSYLVKLFTNCYYRVVGVHLIQAAIRLCGSYISPTKFNELRGLGSHETDVHNIEMLSGR